MGNQINTQPQTFKTNTVVMGSAAGLSAVSGLTVYGDISASGTIYKVLRKSSYTQPSSPNTITLSAGKYSSDAENHLVFFDGVMQEYGVDYTLSGSTLSASALSGVTVTVVALL
jgi:hypothetical protein